MRASAKTFLKAENVQISKSFQVKAVNAVDWNSVATNFYTFISDDSDNFNCYLNI